MIPNSCASIIISSFSIVKSPCKFSIKGYFTIFQKLDNLIKSRSYKTIFEFQKIVVTASVNYFVKVPDEINIIEVIIALPSYPRERLTFSLTRNSAENLPFYSAGAFVKAFNALFTNDGFVNVSHWDSSLSMQMMVGVFYQS